jgi:phage/plasmid-like protein (TIGR03299 family)
MEQIKSFLKQSDLDWNVRQEVLQTESGIVVDGHMAVVREDTNKVLSVMSDSYQPYQNHELLELLYRVSKQTGLALKKGGSFKDGARVYFQLKSNDLTMSNNDRVEGYLTGVNSFDGSTSLAFGPSNVTISCMNSFFAAFRSIQTKVRHTKNMIVKIDEICAGLDRVLEQEKEIFDNIIELSQTKVSDKNIDMVLRTLFNIKPEINYKDDEQVSTNLKNKMSRFYVDLDGEMKEKGNNLWGVFSGVTKFTTHSLSKGDNTEAKMFDIYGQREKQIFNNLVELV